MESGGVGSDALVLRKGAGESDGKKWKEKGKRRRRGRGRWRWKRQVRLCSKMWRG